MKRDKVNQWTRKMNSIYIGLGIHHIFSFVNLGSVCLFISRLLQNRIHWLLERKSFNQRMDFVYQLVISFHFTFIFLVFGSGRRKQEIQVTFISLSFWISIAFSLFSFLCSLFPRRPRNKTMKGKREYEKR